MAMCVWELKRFAATVGEVGAAAVKSVRAAADERTMGNNAKYTTLRNGTPKKSPAALTSLRRKNTPNIRYITVHNVTSRNLNVLDMEHNTKTGP